MSIDHIGIGGIKDLNGTRKFYEEALGPLGYKVQMEYPGLALGFGTSPYKPDFWLASGSNQQYGDDIITTSSAHIAFKGSRAQVHAFHEAALQAGGKCNGPPGFRYYHPFYYAAFVLDPNGNNIEVVNHGSTWQWILYLIGTKLGLVAKHEKKD